jgi:hypothetical protein
VKPKGRKGSISSGVRRSGVSYRNEKGRKGHIVYPKGGR